MPRIVTFGEIMERLTEEVIELVNTAKDV